MNKYAKLMKNKVQNVFFSDTMTESEKVKLVPATFAPYVDASYTFDNGVFVPPSLDYIKEQAKIKVKAIRKLHEEGGMALPNGIKVATAVVDQNRITTALTMMREANIDSIPFKADSGFVELTLPELQGIAQAIALHVQGCFAKEKALNAIIDTKSTVEDIIALDLDGLWNS